MQSTKSASGKLYRRLQISSENNLKVDSLNHISQFGGQNKQPGFEHEGPHSKRSLNITEVERHKIDTGVPVYTTGETGRVNIGWYPSFVQASDGSDLSWSGKKSPENSAFTLRGIAKLRHCVVLPVSTHYCIRTKPFALQTQINLFWRKYSSARTQHSSCCSGVTPNKGRWARLFLLKELMSSAYPMDVPEFKLRKSDMQGRRVIDFISARWTLLDSPKFELLNRRTCSSLISRHATIYFLRDNAYGVSFDQELLHVLHQGFWTMSDAFFNHLVTERQKDASEMLYCASLVPKCNKYTVIKCCSLTTIQVNLCLPKALIYIERTVNSLGAGIRILSRLSLYVMLINDWMCCYVNRSMKSVASRKDPFTVSTITRLIAKFVSTGSVLDFPGKGKNSLSDERAPSVQNAVEQLQSQSTMASLSITQVSRLTGIPRASVRRIMRRHLHLYPYRFTLLQNITEEDKEHRVTFANWLLDNEKSFPTFYGAMKQIFLRMS
ncbi:hypothetical protein CLF_107702 [Clonorchis sinensis]|uniref:Uncharacterized protein n=1 Tax=Clonorchis sinensis TaxID=79923 RepID=G7YH24_CLOSI|nr:hypothetical protein CLF_107702 [Clonorchis sinensis]